MRRSRRACRLVASLFALASLPAVARSAAGQEATVSVPPALQESSRPSVPPPPLAFAGPALTLGEKLLLPALSESELAALAAPSPKPGPLRIGITRELQRPIIVCGEGYPSRFRWPWAVGGGRVDPLPDGGVVWTTAVLSPGASGLRLHFDIRSLPEEVEIDFYSLEGERAGPFTKERMIDPTSFWGPTVFSGEVYVELRAPSAALFARVDFSIDRVAHLSRESFPESAADFRPTGEACLRDYMCATVSIDSQAEFARKAIASILYQSSTDGQPYVCTGTLLNDTDPSSYIPYFLTANHCVSDSATAGTIDAWWDYVSQYCGSTASSHSGPTIGATLLAHSSSSDFSFLRFWNDPPADNGRSFLGWIAAPETATAEGLHWYRLHHPGGDPLFYSEGTVVRPEATCSALPGGNFTYSLVSYAGQAGGSSGSAAYVNLGVGPQVIGQLYGACGANPSDPCDPSNDTVDGSFYVTYQSIKQWLNPPQPPAILSISPSAGPVGIQVIISGAHLTGTTVVSFNGTVASFSVLSDTQVRATVPAGATTGYYALATPNGTAYGPTAFTVTPTNPPPAIYAISPTSGPPGTVVTIDGANLSTTRAVSFNGLLATFSVFSDTRVRATVPERVTSGYVGLATAYGTAYAPTGFTLIEPNLAVPFGASGDIPVAGDFDGDGRSEFAVFRPSRGAFYADLGRNGWRADEDLAVSLGTAGDIPLVGDFDGDGISDFGVFRPSTGTYYVRVSGSQDPEGTHVIQQRFGAAGDIPLVGDFNADGQDEFAVFRPASGTWYVDLGQNGWHSGEDLAVPFGLAGDIPFVGDFDGDGYSDLGVFRPSTGWYYVDLGRNGGQGGRYLAAPFGAAGDVPFAGDFDGDGRDEFGVFRPSNGYHYVDLGHDGWVPGRDIARPFGIAGDVPFVGKFNYDGRSDIGVFRPGQGWYYVDLGN